MDDKMDFVREFKVHAPRVLASLRALSAKWRIAASGSNLVQKQRGERL